MYVHFIRHGESDSNANNLLYQPIDEPLTEAGLVQARAAAERYRGRGIGTIHSSDMTRALLTAGLIADRANATIYKTELLREIRRPSSLHGFCRTDPEAVRIAKEAEKAMLERSRYHDEETFDELVDRAGRALEMITATKENDVIVVTHGGFLRFLIAYMLQKEGLTPDSFLYALRFLRTKNTGITVVEYTPAGTWHLVAWNDHAHLSGS